MSLYYECPNETYPIYWEIKEGGWCPVCGEVIVACCPNCGRDVQGEWKYRGGFTHKYMCIYCESEEHIRTKNLGGTGND